MNSERDFDKDKNWNWVRPVKGVIPYLVMEEHGGNTYEAVVKHGYPPKVLVTAVAA
jgi:hypothetical protein